jgi:hypothetical protein
MSEPFLSQTLMSNVFVPAAAVILTTTLFAYTLAVSYQLAVLVSDGIRSRAFPDFMSLAAVWQNFGLTFALFGFLDMDMTNIVFGVLLIALRMVTLPLRAPSWDSRFEPALLMMAVASLALLGSIHFLPRLAA